MTYDRLRWTLEVDEPNVPEDIYWDVMDAVEKEEFTFEGNAMHAAKMVANIYSLPVNVHQQIWLWGDAWSDEEVTEVLPDETVCA